MGSFSWIALMETIYQFLYHVSLIRQLISNHFTPYSRSIQQKALIIGDPDYHSFAPQLPGASKEAEEVAETSSVIRGFTVNSLRSEQVPMKLFLHRPFSPGAKSFFRSCYMTLGQWCLRITNLQVIKER